MKTDVIRIAQDILKQRGLYSGRIDGLAGAKTLKAVITAIGSKYDLHSDPARAEEYCVMFLQDYAATLGIDAGPVDGLYGRRTAAAVKQIAEMETGEPAEVIDTPALLTDADIDIAAYRHRLEPALVKAVTVVESRGRGFLRSGRPRILFEGHVFWRQLKLAGLDPERIAPTLPQGILYPKWTHEWYVGGEKEYDRLDAAIDVDYGAALKSASWGLFQIMGFNYKSAGFYDVQEFLAAMMYGGELAHLEAFLSFITAEGMIDDLRRHKWSRFARRFNGIGYKLNRYPTKLAQAYKRYSQ